ncbi:MAG TPA: hypothetical protein P5572_22140 [Phycisphaerae bacterium]|nr:hypothetical protein [Phycisphaerae bacterium]
MQVMMDDRQAQSTELAARLFDEPGFSWTTLGALLRAAADEAAAEADESATDVAAIAAALAWADEREGARA